jgi:SAM-dependent methyltransferase
VEVSDVPALTADEGGHRLEHQQRLSESLLWDMQRRFYVEHGIAAWQSGMVPERETATPALADAFARVVLGHLRDRARAGASTRTYIVEVGGGTGRFAHHFLEQLLPRLELVGAAVTYVLTDVAPKLLEHWRAHPRLAEHLASGALDLGLFDAAKPAPIELMISGVTLAPGACEAPLVVIANAVLGELPADCFSIRSGVLEAGLCTLVVADPSAPVRLEDIEVEMSAAPVDATYYGVPALDAILDAYRDRLAETAVLFPIGAVRCLDYLRTVGGGALALIADRGPADERALHRRVEPQIDLHGGFSLQLNLHALASYTRATGGRVYQPASRSARLEVLALALGMPAPALETAAAFREAIEHASPGDTLIRTAAAERGYDQLELGELLAVLRCGDPAVLAACFRPLFEHVGDATDDERADISAALARLWDAYFSIGEPGDFALALAALHDRMGDLEEARWYVDHSLRLRGWTPQAGYQLARCHHRLGERADAERELDLLLARAPTFGPARELRTAMSTHHRRSTP